MRVSPSQIKLFRSCQRAWYYYKHAPRGPRVQTKAQAFGDEVQDHLDAFLERGVIPPLSGGRLTAGRVALSGLRHLPAPGPWNMIEYEFTVPLVEDGDDPIFLTGRMDCYVPSRDMVLDHKTSWSIERYAMTEEQFENDPQRISYAFAHLQLVDTARVAITRWVYYQTTAPLQSKVLEREDTRDTIDVYVDSLRLSAREMRAKRDDREATTRNFAFCTDYGGCDHFEQCFRDNPQGHDMSVIEELRAKAAKKKAGQVQPVIDTTAVEKPTVAPEPEPEPEPAPAPPEVPADTKLPPKRRGRPPGSKNKAAEAAPVEVETEAPEPAVSSVRLEDFGPGTQGLFMALRAASEEAAKAGFRLTFTLSAGE